jgi:WD40 repeat protein
MAKGVRPGSVRNKNGEYKWWFVLWRLPNLLFEARGSFLGGEPDELISRLAFWRAIVGVGVLVYIAYAYPGYLGGAHEFFQTDGIALPGLGTMLRFDTVWVTSIVYALILSAIWIALFALLILPITRPGARLGLLLHLCWPAATIMLCAGQFMLIVQLYEWSFAHFSSNPNATESLGILVSFVIIWTWLIRVVYLAATDVFRGDDAHPLLAPFVSTGVSWMLAYVALSSSGPSGVPHSFRWLTALAGPVTVTVLNAVACLRIRKEHGQLLFLDGPPPGSRYRQAAAHGASGLSRREFVRLAVPSAVAIGAAAWWAPDALALASTRSNQAVNFMRGTPSSNTLPIGQHDFVNSVAFSPDGRTLAAGTTEGTVLLWDVTHPANPGALPPPLSGQDGVGPVAFSPDGRILASGSDGSGTDAGPAIGNIQLWDVTRPATPATLGPAITASGEVSSLAFSPDGRILASGSDGDYSNYGAGTIQLWDVNDPTRPAALGQSSTDQGFRSLAFSPRGHTLASGDLDGGVQLWNVADPARPAALAQFRADTSGFVSVTFSPDGRTLVSGDNSGQVRLWNVADPARPAALGPPLSIAHSVSSLAFSPDGRTLAASSNGGYASATSTTTLLFDSPGYIRLWDVSDPAHPTRPSPYITAGSAGFCSVAFSPDGRILASGSDGSGSGPAAGGVQLWNVADPARPTVLGKPLT